MLHNPDQISSALEFHRCLLSQSIRDFLTICLDHAVNRTERAANERKKDQRPCDDRSTVFPDELAHPTQE